MEREAYEKLLEWKNSKLKMPYMLVGVRQTGKTYKIVCAGSLLGVKINRFKSSFPVGKVWIDYLYPMNFSEFLKAIGEENY